jgi:hypothetical protein
MRVGYSEPVVQTSCRFGLIVLGVRLSISLLPAPCPETGFHNSGLREWGVGFDELGQGTMSSRLSVNIETEKVTANTSD